MKVINIKDNDKYLNEYIKLCSLEWGKPKSNDEMELYILNKLSKIRNDDKVICVKGLIDDDILIGFISLFKYDGDERCDLTPWYATMYVKEEYRGNDYSKILNNAILKEAKFLGFDKVYLKTDLINYYEKFGATKINQLTNGESLYFIEL